MNMRKTQQLGYARFIGERIVPMLLLVRRLVACETVVVVIAG
jgi:hypothetical protein